jgi:hypothetical protein
MRGLDPRIHDAFRQNKPYGRQTGKLIMDRRVKPGGDSRL